MGRKSKDKKTKALGLPNGSGGITKPKNKNFSEQSKDVLKVTAAAANSETLVIKKKKKKKKKKGSADDSDTFKVPKSSVTFSDSSPDKKTPMAQRTKPLRPDTPYPTTMILTNSGERKRPHTDTSEKEVSSSPGVKESKGARRRRKKRLLKMQAAEGSSSTGDESKQTPAKTQSRDGSIVAVSKAQTVEPGNAGAVGGGPEKLSKRARKRLAQRNRLTSSKAASETVACSNKGLKPSPVSTLKSAKDAQPLVAVGPVAPDATQPLSRRARKRLAKLKRKGLLSSTDSLPSAMPGKNEQVKKKQQQEEVNPSKKKLEEESKASRKKKEEKQQEEEEEDSEEDDEVKEEDSDESLDEEGEEEEEDEDEEEDEEDSDSDKELDEEGSESDGESSPKKQKQEPKKKPAKKGGEKYADIADFAREEFASTDDEDDDDYVADSDPSQGDDTDDDDDEVDDDFEEDEDEEEEEEEKGTKMSLAELLESLADDSDDEEWVQVRDGGESSESESEDEDVDDEEDFELDEVEEDTVESTKETADAAEESDEEQMEEGVEESNVSVSEVSQGGGANYVEFENILTVDDTFIKDVLARVAPHAKIGKIEFPTETKAVVEFLDDDYKVALRLSGARFQGRLLTVRLIRRRPRVAKAQS